MPGAQADGAGGCTLLFIRRTSETDPMNGGLPTSASKSSAPTPYQSEAGVGGAPVACSGAM
jgi:hypothetical protein